MRNLDTADLIVVGAGAAGLATSIFFARAARGARVRCLDGARVIGAKILVSGGGRCNVTNRIVTERDFWGGSSRVVRNVLHAFPAQRAVTFFEELGVSLHEEEDGKLFPDSNRARDIVTALLREADRLGIEVHTGARVTSITRPAPLAPLFTVETADGARYSADSVALTTGGKSLPKSGSDGGGYLLAAALGHGHVATTPALVPMLLDDAWHARVSGVSHSAEAIVRIDGRIAQRLRGPVLWTHFGASGPLMLNVSRHWHRASLEGDAVDVLLNSAPGETFDAVDAWLQDQQLRRPRASVTTVVTTRLPAAVAAAWVDANGIDADTTMSHLDREARRRLVRCLVELPLSITGSRGYNYAEVTAGGVPLDEVTPATLESRKCEGLYLAGEILDVDGRLGGFNFQWAWASGFVAGSAVARHVLANGRGHRA
jgi:hypothetical protein